jgi:hypothetical protein
VLYGGYWVSIGCVFGTHPQKNPPKKPKKNTPTKKKKTPRHKTFNETLPSTHIHYSSNIRHKTFNETLSNTHIQYSPNTQMSPEAQNDIKMHVYDFYQINLYDFNKFQIYFINYSGF